MPTAHPQLLVVHELLRRYVHVDIAVFKFSWRQLLPIPGVFEAIPFARHSVELSDIIKALDEVLSSLRGEDLPVRYVKALLEAVRSLEGVCQNLAHESSGNVWSYKYRGYRSDVAEYHRLVDEYTLLGAQLNRRFR